MARVNDIKIVLGEDAIGFIEIFSSTKVKTCYAFDCLFNKKSDDGTAGCILKKVAIGDGGKCEYFEKNN